MTIGPCAVPSFDPPLVLSLAKGQDERGRGNGVGGCDIYEVDVSMSDNNQSISPLFGKFLQVNLASHLLKNK